MNTETTPALSIDSIKELMDGFDPAALLPELDTVFGKLELVCRIAVMIGPVLLLLLGLSLSCCLLFWHIDRRAGALLLPYLLWLLFAAYLNLGLWLIN